MSRDTYITDFFTSINECIVNRGFDVAIREVENMHKFVPGDAVKAFAEAVIKILKQFKDAGYATVPEIYIIDLQKEANEQQAQKQVTEDAIKNNRSPLRELVAQKRFSIASLSRETGIAQKTLSKHLIDGNFRLKYFCSLREALKISATEAEYYFFDSIYPKATAS